MAFYIGDVPAQPFVIEPPESIDLDLFVNADATIIAPDGTVYSEDVTATLNEVDITVDLPPYPIFTGAGIFRLRVQLDGADGSQRLPDVRLVVQDADSGWHTVDSIREEWADAEVIADPLLWRVLEVSKGECIAFAPKLADGAAVPINYLDAQGMHARNRWNARKVAPDGSVGSDDFVLRPFPLDWHVKATLRPKRGVPVIG